MRKISVVYGRNAENEPVSRIKMADNQVWEAIRGGWTRPRDVRNNCIPEHGALENVWGKRFFLVLSFTRAPRTEFGETLGRCSR